MSLLVLRNLCLGFGEQVLLDNINLTIRANERIGLVGRNGCGKSTLLNLIEGKQQADDGKIVIQDGLCVARLIQQIPNDIHGAVRSIIALGSPSCGELLGQYYRLDDEPGEELLQQLNESDAWQVDQKIKTLASKFELDLDIEFSTLSGGLKRRVFLAQSLLSEPQLLLLDEPTNHLDIETIEWMEKLLSGLNVAQLIVSHDRAFINRLATRILDLDRGQLSSWPGNYDQYLSGKEKAIEDEQAQDKAFDKRLAKEETWIRQGIKARRTRNEGRVRALKKMRSQRAQRVQAPGSAGFALNQGARSGKLVAEAVNLGYGYADGGTVIDDFSTTVLRGDKIGIIGPNGCGKSTLIKLLTGELQPGSGSIELGTRLEIAYLDQHRKAIRDDYSVFDNISQGASEVTINGKPRHVMSYIQDFLFSPERARAPASALSGGERNRLMLAKLFTRPFNLLVLDEPTNDLDIDTLELLEQRLVEYAGTLLLVSHDRRFLDNTVTSTLVFEGSCQVNEYVGGYDDWLRQRKQDPDKSRKESKNSGDNKSRSKTRKPGYKEQRELEALPGIIESLESRIETLQQNMAVTDFYKQDDDVIAKSNLALKRLQDELAQSYSRWELLENLF